MHQSNEEMPMVADTSNTFWNNVQMSQLSGKLTQEYSFHEQHAIVYDREFVTTEPVKKMNDAYKAFKIQSPVTIMR